jgi:hypothetical protein
MAEGALIIVDWQFICLLMCVSSMFNLPFTKAEWERGGIDVASLMFLYAALLFVTPWVCFYGMYNGRKEGCDIRTNLAISASIYSGRSVLTGKIASFCAAVFAGSSYLLCGLYLLVSWCLRRRILEFSIRSSIFRRSFSVRLPYTSSLALFLSL